MKAHYRQGDILFIKTNDGIPESAEKQPDGVIAHGEVTGHTHRIRSPKEGLLLVAAGVSYLKGIAEFMNIDHEEHDTIALPMGDYVVRRQREYLPSGWRQVVD